MRVRVPSASLPPFLAVSSSLLLSNSECSSFFIADCRSTGSAQNSFYANCSKIERNYDVDHGWSLAGSEITPEANGLGGEHLYPFTRSLWCLHQSVLSRNLCRCTNSQTALWQPMHCRSSTMPRWFVVPRGDHQFCISEQKYPARQFAPC